jgi:iron complex outermembrane recepter protein
MRFYRSTGLRHIASLAAASASILGLSSVAHAQIKPAKAEASEGDSEIIVTGKFLDTGASSATKLDIPVLDTPFSVASYNREFLKAIETTSVSDLYRYMTGVQRAGNTGYDVTIRGFKNGGADRNSFMTDGMPGLSVRFGSPPTVGVDHIEIVKGPTSVLYGQAQPGGFINIITKKPKANPHLEFSVKGTHGLGKLDRARSLLASIDVGGAIDKDEKLLVRLVAEAGDSKGFRQYSYEHPVYIAPSLTWNIGPDTSLTLMGEHRATRTHYDNQLAAPGRSVALIAAHNISYQAPGDFQVERGTVGSVMFEHKFSRALKFNLAYRYVDHFDSATGYDSAAVQQIAVPKLTRRARGQENIRTYGFLDVNFTGDFDTFGIGHKMILGGTIGKETSNFNRLQFWQAPVTASATAARPTLDIDIYNPVHNEPLLSTLPLCNIGGVTGTVVGTTIAACSVAGSTLTWQDAQQRSKGAYFSDLITLHEWVKIMVGLRYADERQNTTELRVAGVLPQAKHDTKWLPLAGVVVQPTKNLSVYGSYA